MNTAPPSFPARVGLALRTAFRILGDADYAQLLLDPKPLALPPAPTEAPARAAPGMSAEATVALRREGALQLLQLLQQGGRLVDFLMQDIAAFADADVGAAARVVHDGARQALLDHADIERVRTEPEGDSVTVEAGAALERVKLTGNVAGRAPFRGTLRHAGWHARSMRLPELTVGADPTVLAQAEVEL